jgi:hypothetical protein
MKRGFIVVASLLFIGSGVAGYAITHANKDRVPQSISKQLQSPAFYPAVANAKIQSDTYKFDPENKLFSYVANGQGTKMVFSMQPSPSEFSEIPESYNKYLDRLNKVTSFDTSLGTANIVEPDDQTGQAAIMNAHGTLLFIKADSKLSEDQWRLIFNSLQEK